MSSSRRRKWVRAIVGLLAAAGLYFSQLWLLPMNYLGYCDERHGWISQDELVRAAVMSVFAIYPRDAIPYASVDEFLRLNPDCCRLTHVGRKNCTAPLNYRVFGWTRGFMHVKYLVRRRELPATSPRNNLRSRPR